MKPLFQDKRHNELFSPRAYILDNLTLERCAQKYLDHIESLQAREAHG